MDRVLKILFFALIIKPAVLIVLGLNIRGKQNLPQNGPAIIAANHNSHLDTIVLMSLYPLSQIHKIRPVAAADYFLKNRLLAWFSLKCIGIIPLNRKGRQRKKELFAACHNALDNGHILILFPEGSRGAPEEMSTIKKGIYHIVGERDDTRITPVMIHGLGRALPRGEALLVPFNCDVIIGESLSESCISQKSVDELRDTFLELQKHCITRNET